MVNVSLIFRAPKKLDRVFNQFILHCFLPNKLCRSLMGFIADASLKARATCSPDVIIIRRPT
ncbi:hypothetical protein D6S13_24035 [Salmonella enterica subsp. enterica]|nr:hypothetical protein [Salmonella enterica subsp. enterica]